MDLLVLGLLFKKSVIRKDIYRNMGHKWLADNAESKQKLGIEYRSPEVSMNEIFQQMIDKGAFERN